MKRACNQCFLANQLDQWISRRLDRGVDADGVGKDRLCQSEALRLLNGQRVRVYEDAFSSKRTTIQRPRVIDDDTYELVETVREYLHGEE